MSELVQGLLPNERRGSKPRCHLLTYGSAGDVAARLTTLAAPFATVSSTDRWMPQGFEVIEEAQLHRAPRLLDINISKALETWWLAPASANAKTPNFDIASTCTIDGVSGLLLVEAKAHDEELNNEAAGRILTADSSDDRKLSHQTIGAAIEEARVGLERATSSRCNISRDSHYQMSNRFAWAWKLTELGVPVVLVYLGFLGADEMRDKGVPFTTHQDWERLVNVHSESLFPAPVWGHQWKCNGRTLTPLIRSLDQSLAEIQKVRPA